MEEGRRWRDTGRTAHGDVVGWLERPQLLGLFILPYQAFQWRDFRSIVIIPFSMPGQFRGLYHASCANLERRMFHQWTCFDAISEFMSSPVYKTATAAQPQRTRPRSSA